MIRNAVSPLYKVVSVVVNLPGAGEGAFDSVVRCFQRIDSANATSSDVSHVGIHAHSIRDGDIYDDRYRALIS